MNLQDDALNSPDRDIRKDFLLQTFKSTENSSERKVEIFTKALQDKHDSLRNLAIEYLTNTYEQANNFDLKTILISHLKTEPIWSVKYLILKKLSKFNLDVTDNSELILKMTHEMKPQIRIAAAEVLLSFPAEKQEDVHINRLLELWKDKDESVRKQLEILLSSSENPKIKEFLADYQKKLAEKEKKKRDIVGMFEGI